MFIPNHNKTEIINVQRVIKFEIVPPVIGKANYMVSAVYNGGSSILYIGNEEECTQFLCNLYNQY